MVWKSLFCLGQPFPFQKIPFSAPNLMNSSGDGWTWSPLFGLLLYPKIFILSWRLKSWLTDWCTFNVLQYNHYLLKSYLLTHLLSYPNSRDAIASKKMGNFCFQQSNVFLFCFQQSYHGFFAPKVNIFACIYQLFFWFLVPMSHVWPIW